MDKRLVTNTPQELGETFAKLGHETRLEVLHTLGDADRPLSFSELLDRIEYGDASNFDYHLNQLVGEFIEQTNEGYLLRGPGRRIMESILAGAVAEPPQLERTVIEKPCPICGAAVEMDYRDEDVGLYCSSCGGTRSAQSDTAMWASDSADILGHMELPPAGVRDRTPEELLESAELWTVTEALMAARGACPRCSAPVQYAVSVCDHPDHGEGHCDRCEQRFRVSTRVTCQNCIVDAEIVTATLLLGTTELMAFMLQHGIDPLAPNGFHLTALQERVLSTKPFEGEFTFCVDEDALVLTVDEGMDVREARRAD